MLKRIYNFYQSLNKWNISKIEKLNLCDYIMFFKNLTSI